MRGARFGELPFLKEDNQVKSCAYSPDGQLLALGLSGGAVILYSTSSWEQVRTLAGHEKDINCLAFSPKGGQIISGSDDCMARLWDVEAGICIRVLEVPDSWTYGVAFSPLGDTVASAHNYRMHVWNVETEECRLIIGTSDSRNYKSVVYSPKGDRIASGEHLLGSLIEHAGACAVRLWDVETGKCLHSMSGHNNTIWEVAYASRGDRIASSSTDATVRIWNVETGACCRVLTGHDDGVYSVAFSPQGDMIASAGQDKTVRIWDAETGTCHQIFNGHLDSVRRVVFSPKGDHIASCSDDKTLRMWDIGSGGTRLLAIGHSKEILSVLFSPQGDQVVSCSGDGSIRLRDAESGVCRRTITSDLHNVATISYSQGGALIVSGMVDKGKKGREENPLTGLSMVSARRRTIVAYSLQRNQVASGDSGGGSMRMEDVKTGKYPYDLYDSSESVNGIVHSPKGIYIVFTTFTRVIIRDIVSENLHQLDGHSDKVMSVAFSPRDDLIASAGRDTTVRLWDMGTEECHRILIGHADCVWVVVFSPQGDQVASGGEDGLVKIWDVGTGECLYTLAGHSKRVRSVIFSTKGDRIVSGSEDKTIRLWDVAPDRCQAVVQVLSSLVLRVAWSTKPDVNCFVVGCEDGSEWMGQVIEDEDGNSCHIRWRWRTVSGGLNLEETSVHDVRGLSQLDKQLLEQRGAEGEPSVRLREVAKNVASMVSVVSNLKQPSTEMALETSYISNTAAGQSE
ncbi:MAG: quinon protein alcohol dehydrogenase-like superfamily [Benniella sp.]|nr:MAG: quinon protein alcohol dehydrogenase-like superfamily [Benniella sp.]